MHAPCVQTSHAPPCVWANISKYASTPGGASAGSILITSRGWKVSAGSSGQLSTTWEGAASLTWDRVSPVCSAWQLYNMLAAASLTWELYTLSAANLPWHISLSWCSILPCTCISDVVVSTLFYFLYRTTAVQYRNCLLYTSDAADE